MRPPVMHRRNTRRGAEVTTGVNTEPLPISTTQRSTETVHHCSTNRPTLYLKNRKLNLNLNLNPKGVSFQEASNKGG